MNLNEKKRKKKRYGYALTPGWVYWEGVGRGILAKMGCYRWTHKKIKKIEYPMWNEFQFVCRGRVCNQNIH